MLHLLLIAAALIFQNGEAYKAAVFEHYPTIAEESAANTIKKNLESYRSQMEAARDQSVNIIVFPEYGLTGIVTDPEEYAINIDNDDSGTLNELKALATEHNMYIVVNLLEKVEEENRETKYYNTVLVYNKEGVIIAKYRKINLYDEPKLTPGNETVTFSTDFGVTFGVFTCFDILFHNPSMTVLKDDRVTDIVFPSAWYSTLPFFSSLSVQHGYVVANGVNLLAANYGTPKKSLGGSGIYAAGGRSPNLYIDSTPSSKLTVLEIPTIDKRKDTRKCSSISPQGLPFDNTPSIADFKTLKSFQSSNYVFGDVDLTKEKISTRLCHKDFCCNFNMTIGQAGDNEHYKLVVYDGLQKIDKVEDRQHVRFCSLVACESDSEDSCGARLNGTTKFSLIIVDGQLPTDNITFYRPVTLNYKLRPLLNIDYCNDNTSTTSKIHLSTPSAGAGVVAFGIYGVSGSTVPNSAVHTSAALILLVSALIKYIVM